jgi:hypothetical protein
VPVTAACAAALWLLLDRRRLLFWLSLCSTPELSETALL